MNIIERGKEFVQQLRQMAGRTTWGWRCCPYCGDTLTCKNGSYTRRPWFFAGRQEIRVQRHWCHRCRRTYSEKSALLVSGSWYAREVHRLAIDLWQHAGGSLRRTAEVVRSWLGRQERWLIWHPLAVEPPQAEQCHLGASTVHRWLDRAGRKAERSVAGQLAGIPTSGQVGTDGLWAKLRGGGKRVVLALVDSISGLLWPPVVVEGEERERSWKKLFERAKEAGLELDGLRGMTSDGANGLVGCLMDMVGWVNHQRCVWHLWRGLGGKIAWRASRAAAGVAGEAADAVREEARRVLVGLVRGVLDAGSLEQAEIAVADLVAHPLGAGLGPVMAQYLDGALIHLLDYNRGLMRVAPEWCWRDFRLRLGRGRNHGSEQRLERALLLWALYRNFTPAQWRSECKRTYRRPGKSPLEVAGVPPGEISYLDALGI